MKHRLNPDSLAVQSFETQTLPADEAFDTYRQCVSEISNCGVCPTETGTLAARA